MEIKPLVRGECPVCKKMIMTPQKNAFINGGMEFWVGFSDGSRAQFSICADCYSKITQEQLDDIMRSQIVNWGFEIQQQLLWYIGKAVHLRIVKHGKTKDAIAATD